MFVKLALKNVNKGFKDYGVYFFTLVFGICIFYMFNSIYAQREVMSVTEGTHIAMLAISKMLSWISIFVSVVLGFLIIYANNFFIRRRKKELGIYMTLGMDKLKISMILILETSILAVAALIVGLIIGVFLSQFMSVFTAKIFEADMTGFKFIFSQGAFLKSIAYFGIIFLVVVIFNTRTIAKYTLIDLINGDRKNELPRIRSFKHAALILLLSCICLGTAYYLIVTNGMLNINIFFTLSILLGSLGTLGFFFGLSTVIIRVIKKNKGIYYNGLNIFTLNQLSSKVNTNFVSMSVVSIILLLTIGIFACGYSMQHIISSELREQVDFDISMTIWAEKTNPNDYDDLYLLLPKKLQRGDLVESYNQSIEYYDEEILYNVWGVAFQGEVSHLKDVEMIFIGQKEYNIKQKRQGGKPIELNGEYALLVPNGTTRSFAELVIQNKSPLTLRGQELKPYGQVLDSQKYIASLSLFVVVEDRYLEGLKVNRQTLNVNCYNESASKTYEKIVEDYTSKFSSIILYHRSKEKLYTASISSKAIISFLAIYLGLVFMITCAAVLSIQQLTDASDNKARYKLLKDIGADDKMLRKALFRQVLSYFLLPLLLAVVHSYFGLMSANKAIMVVGEMNILETIVATSVFVVSIYGVYFGLTYVGCKNTVFRNI